METSVEEAQGLETIEGADKIEALSLPMMQRYQQKAMDLIPCDEASAEACAAFIEEAKNKEKAIEAFRDEKVRPLNEQVAYYNRILKPFVSAYGNAWRTVSERLGRYVAEQKRKAEEEQRRINAEAERKRLELERKAEEERRKAIEAAAQGDAEAAAKAEAKAEKIEAKAATVAPAVVEQVSNKFSLGRSTLSVRAPQKDWMLPGWDKAKPLPVLSGSFGPLVGDLSKLPDGLKWLLRFCDVNPVRLNAAFKSGEKFPKPFAEIEKYGGSNLRSSLTD